MDIELIPNYHVGLQQFLFAKSRIAAELMKLMQNSITVIAVKSSQLHNLNDPMLLNTVMIYD